MTDGISHGPWDCIEEPEEDGDGFTTRGWYARNRVTGETRILNHSRFNFHMTPERFSWLAAHNFPRSPGKGPWTNETIDLAMENDACS